MKINIKTISKTIILALIVLLLSCDAPPKPEEPKQPAADSKAPAAEDKASAKYNETARFLSGEPVAKSSSLYQITKNKFYREYAADLSNGWKNFQHPNLEKMKGWWGKHFTGKAEKNILYPFSGPDIMNVMAFFPDGDTYTLFGLEHPGDFPDPHSMNEQQISRGLTGVRRALNSILRTNFFHTKRMAKDLENKSFNSIAGLMMIFLAKQDCTVTNVRKIIINAEGEIAAAGKRDNGADWQKQPKSRVPGIEISFRKGNGKIQIVRYFMLNVVDQSLEALSPNFIPYIEKGAPYSTFLKSASYLMHNDTTKFTKIRTAILETSSSIAQDDSGIPLRYLNTWDVSFHGVYDKPIKLFANRVQADLQKSMEEKSTGALPFSFGYDYKKGQSNLLIAGKKQ
jgi:hypothetical protein